MHPKGTSCGPREREQRRPLREFSGTGQRGCEFDIRHTEDSMMKSSVSKFRFRQGTVPLLVSMPHSGVHIPPEIADGMTDAALKLPDTDWHIEQLYDFLEPLGVSVLCATHSRYVIDLNRPLDGADLYPGQ